jgi:integral membrane protein
MNNPIALLRTVTLIEGVSFLVLLFIAMPLKYVWNLPQAVRIVGMAHGILFLIFCFCLAQSWIAARWPLGRAALVFGASIIPFGPWLIDRRLKSYEAAFVTARRNGRSPAGH